MLGNGWASTIDHTDRQRCITKWNDCVATHTPYSDIYTIVINGQKKHIETHAFSHSNEEGNILFYVGYVKELPQ